MSSDDEHALPTHPRSFAIPAPPSTSNLRKRSRDCESSNSSDAPFFSSDDLAEASLNNYESPRRKRLSRRSWWQTDDEPAQQVQRKHLKRQGKQFHDSGVFMSSDGGSSNEDGFNVESLPIRGHKRQDTETTIRPSSESRADIDAEERASRIVFHSLEYNNEVVDLSNIALASLSSETLRPLRDLINIPRSQQNHGSYQSFAPKLKILLSNNLLQRMPNEITNLNNLTVLSLRHNQLTELPHSMGKLSNLVELNVAGNRLRWLPGELLDLVGHGKLTTLNIYPNPLLQAFPLAHADWWGQFAAVRSIGLAIETFIVAKRLFPGGSQDGRFDMMCHIQEELSSRLPEVDENDDDQRAVIRQRNLTNLNSWKRQPVLLGLSAVAYYHYDGTVLRNNQPPPSRLDENVSLLSMVTTEVDSQPRQPHNQLDSGRVLSLFELAARACGEYLQLPKDGDILADHGPDNVTRILSDVRDALEDGGKHCSICRRSYLVPRAEWIEYWHCAPDSLNANLNELYLPFLQRACSWDCAAKRRRVVIADYH